MDGHSPLLGEISANGSEDVLPFSQTSKDSGGHGGWLDSDDDDDEPTAVTCPLCGSGMPNFAISAHLRFHESLD
jgi:hypothetical protein